MGEDSYINYSQMSDEAKKAAEEAAKAAADGQKKEPPKKPKEKKKATEVEPYLVSLTVKKLNVRKGPAKKSQAVSVLKIGKSVKIVAEFEGKEGLWGKLESGGWINLEFTKKKELKEI